MKLIAGFAGRGGGGLSANLDGLLRVSWGRPGGVWMDGGPRRSGLGVEAAFGRLFPGSAQDRGRERVRPSAETRSRGNGRLGRSAHPKNHAESRHGCLGRGARTPLLPKMGAVSGPAANSGFNCLFGPGVVGPSRLPGPRLCQRLGFFPPLVWDPPSRHLSVAAQAAWGIFPSSSSVDG